MQPSPDTIRLLEEISLNALPSLRTVVYDGWLLRFANGYTQRGNSVQSLNPGVLPLAEKIAYCEETYRSRGLPPLFKLTDASQPQGLDAELEARGYEIRTPVSVQTRDTYPAAARTGVEVEEEATEEWLEAFFRLSRLPAERHETFVRMVRSIVPASGFASRRAGGLTVAVGLGVVERGWSGLFDIVTDPDYRQQGHATALMDGLMAWAHERGAERAYLQVTKTNEPALALYQKLGFRHAYTYWYRGKE